MKTTNLKTLTTRILTLLLCVSLLAGLCGCSAKPADNSGAPVSDVSVNPDASTTPDASTDSNTATPDSSVDSDTATPDASAGSDTPVTAEAFPVTLTDQAGREVTISKQPEKIVSGYYITTSLLIALGCKDKVVGLEAKAASRNIYSLAAPEMIELPNIGSAKDFNLETCISLEPDLVILPKKLADPAETLAQLGIPVLLVNPENTELFTEAAKLIASACGCADTSSALLAFQEERLQFMNEQTAGLDTPTVYLSGNSDFLTTAPSGMYQNSLITTAGGKNVAGESEDNYWITVSYEQLLAWDPDYIVIVPDAAYSVDDILSNPELSMLSAVQNGSVYAMPSAFEAWDSPVPSAILGNLWMLNLLHPDVYSSEQLATDVTSFYSTFYGFTADTALLAK